jgi:dipeptidyl aminopeptidase/acylaminoacyl peptidase
MVINARFAYRSSLLFLAALFLLPCPADLFGEVLTPHHVAKIRTVTSAVISPDGSQIAYLLNVPRELAEEDDGAAWSELHVIRVAGEQDIPFITGAVNISSIQWTPDGSGISFLAKRGEDEFRSLYVIPSNGGEAKRALSLESNILSYSWAPDAVRVALVAVEPEADDVAALKKQGFSQQIIEEDWRPRKVFIANTETADVQAMDLPGSAFELAWCPTDDRLAVSLAPRPLVDDSYMFKKVHVVRVPSGEVVSRIDNPGKLEQVVWSGDGRYLALNSGIDIHDPSTGRLMVVPAQGGGLTNLLGDHAGHVLDIDWAGNSFGCINAEGVWTSWETISPTGLNRSRRLSAEGPILNSASLSSDGTVATFVAHTPQHPAEVFLWRPGESSVSRLTNSNPWLEEISLGRHQVIRYPARDGLEIEGILIQPAQESSDPVPLILSVHGGPEAHHSNGWLTSYSRLGQMASGRGFAVFYSNYRGSTGRGVEFSKLSQGDPAGKEFDDLVDGVDHLVQMGVANRNRVGITGGSYGGYATAWGSTFYSDRFAAGVMFVGISNKISKVGTTDIPEEEFLVHALKRPWDDWQFFLERSPIYHARKSETPLLILHGADDPRVNVGQSRELFRQLKIHGKAPVRLVLYPGEGHGNRRAASRLDYSLRALRWFEHFLVDSGKKAPPYEIDYGIEAPSSE